MSAKEFLELEASLSNGVLEEHLDNCGVCHHRRIMGQVAEDMLKADNDNLQHWTLPEAMKEWNREVKHRWQQSKYYQLAAELQGEGKDLKAVEKVFEERGWEM